MKYNEKVERCAPKLGRKNLANGLSCPPFVYMDDDDDGMWVHYVKYCENIAKQKYNRCLLRSVIAGMNATHFKDLFYGAGSEALADEYNKQITIHYKWQKLWRELAEKFKE